MKYYSHHGVEVCQHLSRVSKLMTTDLLESMEKYKEAIGLVGICHDFGKYTSYFQDRLFGIKTWKNEGNHSLISAIFTSFVIREKKLGDRNNFYLLAFNIVKCHHSSVKPLYARLPQNKRDETYFDNEFKHLIKQIEDIRSNREYIIDDMRKFGIEDEFNSFLDDLDLKKFINRLRRETNNYRKLDIQLDDFFIHQYIYSLLIDADKLVASKTPIININNADYTTLDMKRKEIIKGSKSLSELNKMRNDIFYKVNNCISDIREQRIFSITSPTGSGKTFTGFYSAKKLLDMDKSLRKIIYVLPFTSIIDQAYDTVTKLHSDIQGFNENISSYIIKHHHLGDLSYVADGEDINDNQGNLLIENWNSGTVVTTFVQLIQSIIGSSNKMLKKYHNIKDAVLILDEIQAIDIKHYPIIETILRYLAENNNCRIIIMTATKPMFLTEADELLEDYQVYFRKMNRTSLTISLEKVSIDGFVKNFLKDYKPSKSYLVVCNTIDQSIDVFNKIRKNELIECKIRYLSTNIIPRDRLDIIKTIKEELEDGCPSILVSTQVVEAGVDLDFNVVYRDIAPIDSIIQCAGRCNRNSLEEVGEVKVIKMIDEEKGVSFGSKVYGGTTIKIAQKTFDDKKFVLEENYLDIIEAYFKLVMTNKSMEFAEIIIDNMKKFEFDRSVPNSIANYSLIDKNDKIDVIILLDSDISDVFNRYVDLYRLEKKGEDEYIELRKLNRELKEYTISLPSGYSKEVEEFSINSKTNLYIVGYDSVDNFYDKEIGFIRNKGFDNYCL